MTVYDKEKSYLYLLRISIKWNTKKKEIQIRTNFFLKHQESIQVFMKQNKDYWIKLPFMHDPIMATVRKTSSSNAMVNLYFECFKIYRGSI